MEKTNIERIIELEKKVAVLEGGNLLKSNPYAVETTKEVTKV